MQMYKYIDIFSGYREIDRDTAFTNCAMLWGLLSKEFEIQRFKRFAGASRVRVRGLRKSLGWG